MLSFLRCNENWNKHFRYAELFPFSVFAFQIDLFDERGVLGGESYRGICKSYWKNRKNCGRIVDLKLLNNSM
jgi:hypothetical protein